jgi:CheY-like chemotaxis protein
MIKVLLVDDNESRASRIIQALHEVHKLEIYQIEHVKSVQQARRSIRAVSYTVVFLDMALPNYDNDSEIDDWGGVRVLGDITKGRGKKPSRIFGFTALDSNVESKQEEFQNIGFSLYYSPSSNLTWLNEIEPQLRYAFESHLGPVKVEKDLVLLTVHGIRTFGSWQERLFNYLKTESSSDSIEHLHFKYVNIDPLTFVFPQNREKVIQKLTDGLRDWLRNNRARELVCVAHSFGTFVLVKALENQTAEDLANVKKIILSGSVLPEDYDFSSFRKKCDAIIFNECAVQDIPLLLSKAFVSGTGMAGKVGFRGIHEKLHNRFYYGGHSMFFDEKEGVMQKIWIPTLLAGEHVIEDKVEDVKFDACQEIITNLARVMSVFKGKYWLIIMLAIVFIISAILF